MIKSLRAFYVYLVAEEYVTLNVMARTKLLKEDKTVIQTFTDKEVAKMIEAYDFITYLNARNKVIVAMFTDAGIRCSELINLETGWINDTNIKIFGKGSKWRYVPMSLMLRKYMIRFERIMEAIYELDWESSLSLKKWNSSKKTWYLNITNELKRKAKILYDGESSITV